MRSDEAFARDVEMRVKEDYPLLAALASGTLLEQARSETNVSEIARAELAKCFAPGRRARSASRPARPLADDSCCTRRAPTSRSGR